MKKNVLCEKGDEITRFDGTVLRHCRALPLEVLERTLRVSHLCILVSGWDSRETKLSLCFKIGEISNEDFLLSSFVELAGFCINELGAGLFNDKLTI